MNEIKAFIAIGWPYAIFLLGGVLLGGTAVWRVLNRQQSTEKVDKARVFEERMATWRRITKAAEGTILDNIAATTPWLAPLIPASIAYHNLIEYLDFGIMLAFVSALCVEFVGLAAVHTVFQLWEYNESKRKSDQSAPFRMGVAVGVAYLVIVLVVNALLEATGIETWTWQDATGVLAKTLLSLLAAVSAFVLAIRSQHARLVKEQEEDKAQRRGNAELGKLRRQAEQAKQLVTGLRQEIQDLKQQVQGGEQLRIETEQLRNTLRQAEVETQQLRNGRVEALSQLEQMETELGHLRSYWDTLPEETQAAIHRHVHGGSYRAVASEFGVGHSAVARQSEKLFGKNGGQDG